MDGGPSLCLICLSNKIYKTFLKNKNWKLKGSRASKVRKRQKLNYRADLIELGTSSLTLWSEHWLPFEFFHTKPQRPALHTSQSLDKDCDGNGFMASVLTTPPDVGSESLPKGDLESTSLSSTITCSLCSPECWSVSSTFYDVVNTRIWSIIHHFWIYEYF